MNEKMIGYICIIFTSVVIAVHGSCPRDVDPCSSSVYIELNEPTRSTAYNESRVVDNDYSLAQGWYRSVSGAGGDMPTHMVSTGQCNSLAPIYLIDDLPEAGDGIVDIPACASFWFENCTNQYTIPVKNCGNFNVYCLFPVDDAYERFCMGSELACPSGYTSATGFTPNCVEQGTVYCDRSVDPCSSNVYMELDEPSRSTAYQYTTTREDDYSLPEAWYRSISGAGGDMPTHAVETGQCNALAPVYLTENLPSVADGIREVNACSVFFDDNCTSQYSVPVKNCGSFNVYCLYPVRDAYERFCIGSELECEDGFTSDTGFSPDCEPAGQSHCDRTLDPCSDYVELDEPNRSTAYQYTDERDDDYSITENWYRSISGAGGDMPTTVVSMGQCNALAPIYLTEELPNEEDGIVELSACASYWDDSCVRQYVIPVKNCSTYNVYCLYPVVDAYERFCVGSELACEDGYTSETGFTPGCVWDNQTEIPSSTTEGSTRATKHEDQKSVDPSQNTVMIACVAAALFLAFIVGFGVAWAVFKKRGTKNKTAGMPVQTAPSKEHERPKSAISISGLGLNVNNRQLSDNDYFATPPYEELTLPPYTENDYVKSPPPVDHSKENGKFKPTSWPTMDSRPSSGNSVSSIHKPPHSRHDVDIKHNIRPDM